MFCLSSFISCLRSSCEIFSCWNWTDRFEVGWGRVSSSWISSRIVCKPVPFSLRSNVVYKYTCPVDPRHCYIGKTQRHLITRIREHRISLSAVSEHCNLCRCSSTNIFSILRSCQTGYELSLSEALLIRAESPLLNSTIVNSGQSVFLTL